MSQFQSTCLATGSRYYPYDLESMGLSLIATILKFCFVGNRKSFRSIRIFTRGLSEMGRYCRKLF